MENEAESYSDPEESDSEESGEEEEQAVNLHVQVDFEARSPEDSDFSGVKSLLRQLLLKAPVDLDELTNIVLQQNYVGCVIKQSEILEEDEDEEFVDDTVFGLTTVINLSKKQNLGCVHQLQTMLIDRCEDVNVKDFLTEAFKRESIGLIINERYINIPAALAVPALTDLGKDIRKAQSKNMPFDFSHFIVISKVHKFEGIQNGGKKKKNKRQPQMITYTNSEEEIFVEESTVSFEYCVKSETDMGLGGNWTEDDSELTPYRKVCVFPAQQFDSIVNKIKVAVESQEV